MAVNRSMKCTSSNQPTPHARVIVVVDSNGNVVKYRVVRYEGGDIGQYYKKLSNIEKGFASRYKTDSPHPYRVHSGIATSIGSFLSLFPEVARPASRVTA